MAMVVVRFRDSQWQWWWCDLGIQTSEEVDSDKVKRRCFFFVWEKFIFLKKKMVKYKIIIFSLPLKLIFKWRSIFHLEPMSIFLATLLKNQ
jgi:hypothetical protein